MSARLKPASINEMSALTALYDQAVLYAGEVGEIDWDYPFPVEKLEEMIRSEELYRVRTPQIIAAVRLSEEGNKDIWPDSSTKALYVGKLVVDSSIRDRGLKIMVPLIRAEAEKRGVEEGRFDCLAHNSRLKSYYAQYFEEVGDVTFINQKGNPLTVSRFSKQL